MTQPMKKWSLKRGFSLVELVAVVGIVSILSLMASKARFRMLIRAGNVEAKTNVRTLYSVAKTYQYENGPMIEETLGNVNMVVGLDNTTDYCPSSNSASAGLPFLEHGMDDSCTNLRHRYQVSLSHHNYIQINSLWGVTSMMGGLRWGRPPVELTDCVGIIVGDTVNLWEQDETHYGALSSGQGEIVEGYFLEDSCL